ncbi:MAG: GGDEF domain-containing protein [Calditrichaeota bacterium]|nr:MAG: GGDEF domain-containing protein [Calditrichota bacterium]
MSLIKNKKSTIEEIHPLQHAINELLIYLKERPDFDSEIIGKVKGLIALSETPLPEKDFSKLENRVKELLFQLEAHDHRNDDGREKCLRRLSKSLIELHIKEDCNNPFEENLINLSQSLERAEAIDELEDVRTSALDIIMKSSIWRAEYQEKYTKAVTSLALKLLRTLRAPEEEYGNFNEKVEALVVNLKKGCDLSDLEFTNERLSLLVKDYSVITDHNRSEREELLRIIKSLVDVLQSYSAGSGVFISGLNTFVEEIRKASDFNDLSETREKLLSATSEMQRQAAEANKEIHVMHERILRAQSRVLSLEDELQKTRSELADALIERDKDALTKLPNRRFFDKEMATALDNFSRHKFPYCVVMIDIDHFKKVNDSFGHQTGDKILENTAIIIRQLLRKIDFLARIGGEEFAAILPNTTPVGSLKVMDRIRQKMESTTFALKNDEIRVTVSFGISELTPGTSAEEWLEQADKALYQAKENGRNRIEIYEK